MGRHRPGVGTRPQGVRRPGMGERFPPLDAGTLRPMDAVPAGYQQYQQRGPPAGEQPPRIREKYVLPPAV